MSNLLPKLDQLIDDVAALERRFSWKPIGENTPKDRFLMLRGDSGMITHRHRIMVARFSIGYGQWRTVLNDPVTDDGPMPTEWMELIP